MKFSLTPILALALMLPFTASSDTSPASAPMKLGAIPSLTGDAGRNGLNWFEGAQLAVDELNKEQERVKLIVEDDGTSPNKVATSFVKLATVDKVEGIVGGTWDFLAETAFPLAKQYRVPFITPTNPVEIFSVSAQANPWVFTNAVTLTAEREVIRNFFKQLGSKRLGLVYINVPYGTSHADLLRDVAKELEISIVSDDEISFQGFRDSLKLAALRISEKKPDAVFAVSNYEGIDFLLRELERLRAQPIVLMTHTLKEAFDFGGSTARYNKAFGVFPNSSSTEFQAAFKKKYGRPPYDYAAAGYDAVVFMYWLGIEKKKPESGGSEASLRWCNWAS